LGWTNCVVWPAPILKLDQLMTTSSLVWSIVVLFADAAIDAEPVVTAALDGLANAGPPRRTSDDPKPNAVLFRYVLAPFPDFIVKPSRLRHYAPALGSTFPDNFTSERTVALIPGKAKSRIQFMRANRAGAKTIAPIKFGPE
jgi:hypothetical protein